MRARRVVSLLYTVPVCLLVTGVLIGVSLCCLPFDPRGTAVAGIFRLWARSILAVCRVRVRYQGLEHIDPSRAYICVANHASLIDVPALMADFPLRLRYVAKEELFHVPVLGTYLRRTHQIPVARGDRRAAARSMVEAARTIAAGGRSVLLFPEGTRSVEGLGPFKEGAALLAIRSGVPLLPIAISGTSRIWPARSAEIRPGTAVISIGPAISASGLRSEARHELTGRVRGEIEAMLTAGQPEARAAR